MTKLFSALQSIRSTLITDLGNMFEHIYVMLGRWTAWWEPRVGEGWASIVVCVIWHIICWVIGGIIGILLYKTSGLALIAIPMFVFYKFMTAKAR